MNGAFKLRNLYVDNIFYNIDIFADNIGSQEGLDKLKAADGNTDSKLFSDFKSLLTGYVRVIKFQPFGLTQDGKPDPSQT
jgi:hypothetical protein